MSGEVVVAGGDEDGRALPMAGSSAVGMSVSILLDSCFEILPPEVAVRVGVVGMRVGSLDHVVHGGGNRICKSRVSN